MGAFAAWGVLALASAAQAASLTFTLDPFTGDDSQVEITLDDAAAGAGNVQISVAVSIGVADIRGIFFDVSDAVSLDGLSVAGADVTDVQLGDVIDLGNGANLNGGGSPCPCDVGVEIGLPGLKGGGDDFPFTTIVLSHALLDLDLGVFAGQSFGVRLTSVGMGDDREGSSKLGEIVPEPSTALLLATGLAGLAWSGRRRSA